MSDSLVALRVAFPLELKFRSSLPSPAAAEVFQTNFSLMKPRSSSIGCLSPDSTNAGCSQYHLTVAGGYSLATLNQHRMQSVPPRGSRWVRVRNTQPTPDAVSTTAR